ncbi:hypothetical protein LVDJXP189_420006 [Flavobacterium psychrophilum]|uniref:hypothetical protein n=1 Tax=Flavobacterium psychrophilum TaxID=96345 RepID=UPI000B7C27C0|nr:hypothetical protein [Flavobacterium psychrophilum]SNB43525.1 hypothetical protein LVDJXP189_420006 [Flavobacterium psychrophilum]
MKLGDVLIMGKSKSINIDDNNEYLIAGVQSYGKGVINRRVEVGKNLKMKKYQVIEENYLMWCKVDTKNGAFGLTKKEHIGSLASTNMALGKINSEKINPEFLEKLFTFDFFHSYITYLSSGTTNRKYLTPLQLCEMVEIPNLSKVEQDEFIELLIKIEKLKIDSEFSNQLNIIKQLRQAFLHEAIQGKIFQTKPEASNVNELQLLEKIKIEKVKLVSTKKIKKEKELSPITEDEIPLEGIESITWVRLGEYFNVTKGLIGIQKAIDGEIPLVVTSEERLTHNEVHFEGKAVIIPLVSSTGHGHASLKRIHYQEGKFAVGNILACIMTILPKYFNMKFIYNYLDTYKEFLFVEKMKGAANVSLKISSINETPIPLLPIETQNKLAELMEFCDGLEQSIKESQVYNEMLLQQVLREALQG